MPNQYNFRSDVTNISQPRFSTSRIVRSTDEGILLEQLPSSFGYETYDVIELHFYSIPDNILILSTIIDVENAEDILKSHIVSYNDGTFKNYIRIDFTKLFEENNLILVPGDYRMVLNFFSDEIGDYDSRKMYLQQISESGTEVQLAFYPPVDEVEQRSNEDELREFVEPSFDRPTAVGVTEKIFAAGVRLDDPSEGLTYQNITDNIETPTANQTVESTLDRIARLGEPVVNEFEKDIEDFLLLLYEYIKNEIIIKSDRRIQENEFQEFIEQAINSKLPDLQKLVENRIIVN
jgi:hypothetical protein